jgi:hypothetical protein
MYLAVEKKKTKKNYNPETIKTQKKQIAKPGVLTISI